MQPKHKLRFAPSPNGYMHLGHAYSALLNFRLAKTMDAEFIIRMEDIDQLRCTDVYKVAWLEDLAMIGVKFDAEIMHQSERQVAYDLALEKLTELGVLYPCLATRGDIKRYYETHTKQYDPDRGLVYPDLYKNLSLTDRAEILNGDVPFTLRVDMKAALRMITNKGLKCEFLQFDLRQNRLGKIEFNPLVWGDVVIARKDIGTSYHLSVTVDDAAQDITVILRGMDLYYATYIQRVLQMLLGLPAPIYIHHELILDADLKKLAKSNKSQPMREMAELHEGLDFISDLLTAVNMTKVSDDIVGVLREKNEI